ncbi:MAG: hypothetical protein IJ662_06445 [Clostridia bacterium]|nr:hypothetical protein [Clostridia bacterium]
MLRIEKGNANNYLIIDESGHTVASFSTLFLASVVKRYLDGDQMQSPGDTVIAREAIREYDQRQHHEAEQRQQEKQRRSEATKARRAVKQTAH